MTTTIEWTQRPGTKGETWNPTRGCSLLSPGCTNCYAMRQAHRFSGKGGPYEGLTKLRKKGGPVWTGKVRLENDMLGAPLHWKKPRTVFVNSMSDLFHERLTNEEIAAVFGVMAACPQHTFQILTKRATRMREWFEWIDVKGRDLRITKYPGMTIPQCIDEVLLHAGLRYIDMRNDTQFTWPLPNVWLGVSAENQDCANERLPELIKTPARVRFVSYEPALGPVDLSIWMYRGVDEARPGDDDYDAIDWVIVGGESGSGARDFDITWARTVIEHCKKTGVACFVKQLGKHPFTRDSPELSIWSDRKIDGKGGDWSKWPKDLRVRQYPEVRA